MDVLLITIFGIICIIILFISLESENTKYDDDFGWEEATSLYTMSTEEALLIIDDAECNGFEVKRVGTKIYFREMV